MRFVWSHFNSERYEQNLCYYLNLCNCSDDGSWRHHLDVRKQSLSRVNTLCTLLLNDKPWPIVAVCHRNSRRSFTRAPYKLCNSLCNSHRAYLCMQMYSRCKMEVYTSTVRLQATSYWLNATIVRLRHGDMLKRQTPIKTDKSVSIARGGKIDVFAENSAQWQDFFDDDERKKKEHRENWIKFLFTVRLCLSVQFFFFYCVNYLWTKIKLREKKISLMSKVLNLNKRVLRRYYIFISPKLRKCLNRI